MDVVSGDEGHTCVRELDYCGWAGHPDIPLGISRNLHGTFFKGISLQRPHFIINGKLLKGVVIMKRMLLTINDPPFEALEMMARRRGMSVQMLLRTIVIPQWLQDKGQIPKPEQVQELIALDLSKYR